MIDQTQPPLTDEHRMLLRMRDTLYEGDWGDFARDLEARASGQAHVFDTVAPNQAMNETIARHLDLITEMARWEKRFGRRLTPDAA